MQKIGGRLFADSKIMFQRCFKISLRNPESLVMATVTPIFLMLLFGAVFGNIADVGAYSYIDFIVPGIILQAVAQASQHTAISVHTDISKGIIDRFRSMPLARPAVLVGHAGASILKNSLTTAIIIGTAFIVGFRPQAGFAAWLIIAGILLLCVAALTWIAILCGLQSKSAEGTSGLMFPFFILPFLSSGFAPTETMHASIRWFAQYQPMTPIIDALRALMLGMPPGRALPIALAWLIGTIIFTCILSVQVYQRKLSK